MPYLREISLNRSAIAMLSGFNPEGGTRNFRFRTRNSHSELYRYLLPVRSHRRPRDRFFLRAVSFSNLATTIEELDRDEPGSYPTPPVIGSYGGISSHEQSHGESLLSVLSRIHNLVRASSQFIIATHSLILMAFPGSTTYCLDETGFTPTRYKDTEHYAVTKAFLECPERVFRELFAE